MSITHQSKHDPEAHFTACICTDASAARFERIY
jgi:hypothetical protein